MIFHLDVEVGAGKLEPPLQTNSWLLLWLLLLLLCVDGMMNDPMEESLVVDEVAKGVAKLAQNRVAINQRRRSPARFLPTIGPVGGHDQRLVFDQTRQRLQYGFQNGPIALLRVERSGENCSHEVRRIHRGYRFSLVIVVARRLFGIASFRVSSNETYVFQDVDNPLKSVGQIEAGSSPAGRRRGCDRRR